MSLVRQALFQGPEFGIFPRFWTAQKIQSFSCDLDKSEDVLSDSFLHYNATTAQGILFDTA